MELEKNYDLRSATEVSITSQAQEERHQDDENILATTMVEPC